MTAKPGSTDDSAPIPISSQLPRGRQWKVAEQKAKDRTTVPSP